MYNKIFFTYNIRTRLFKNNCIYLYICVYIYKQINYFLSQTFQNTVYTLKRRTQYKTKYPSVVMIIIITIIILTNALRL